MPPGVAVAAIESISRVYQAQLVALDPNDYAELIRNAPSRGIAGGRVYDALIPATAVKAGASAILTLNARDFAELEPGLAVLVPGQ